MTNQMKVTTSALQDVLKAVDGVVGKRVRMPILHSILIDHDVFTVTNLDYEVRVTGGVVKKFKAPIALEYRGLKDMLKYVDDKTIEIMDNAQDSVSMSFNGANYDLSSYNPDNFPTIDFPKRQRSWKINNAGIIEAMRDVRFAVSDEETRYYLNGICLVNDDNGAPHVVATNGHILAFSPIGFIPEGAEGKIIPKGVIDFLLKKKIEPDTVAFSPSKRMQLIYPGIKVTAKLIDGVYPDWRRVVPKNNKPHFTIELGKLTQLINRIVAYGRSDGSAYGISFSQCQANKLRVFGSKAGQTFTEFVDVDMHTKHDKKLKYTWQLGCSHLYLKQVCKAFSGCDKITFLMSSEGAPATIEGDNSTLKVVLMPMRVKHE